MTEYSSSIARDMWPIIAFIVDSRTPGFSHLADGVPEFTFTHAVLHTISGVISITSTICVNGMRAR